VRYGKRYVEDAAVDVDFDAVLVVAEPGGVVEASCERGNLASDLRREVGIGCFD
jgi:hypothetical protein